MSVEQAEESSPTSSVSPGKPQKHNIKERLNLHVKRRLQETTCPTEITNCVPTKQEKVAPTTPTSSRGVKRFKGKHSTPNTPQPEDDCSRDGNSSCNDGKEKENGPDILTTVLNDKKTSLLRDPEVIKFLSNIVSILDK